MDKNEYKRMMEQAVPSAALIQKTKRTMMKEEPIMMKRSSGAVTVAVLAVVLLASTAFAAWHFLRPGEVAGRFEDHALSAAFDSEAAININQSAASGDYVFTLLAVVTGRDITDMPYYSDTINDERTYAVVAIQNADGTPMPNPSDAAYGETRFIATPLIKGMAPWLYNAVTMNGGYSETVADGVLYRVVDCDGVTIFADRGLYFGIATSVIVDNSVFSIDEKTGNISVNPDYKGSSAIFDLPLDKSLADPAKAQQYLDGVVGGHDGEDADANADDACVWYTTD